MKPLRVAILAPHRDDAAFSCGLTILALLRGGAHLCVVNVFTVSDYAVDLSTVDATLPLVDGVSRARLQEDRNFLADLLSLAGQDAVRPGMHDLQWHDAPLRLAVPTEDVLRCPLGDAAVAVEAQQLAETLQHLGAFDVVFAPLALGDHIDHRVAREAALLLPCDCVCWYEDLPYAARMSLHDRETGGLAVMRSKCGAKGLRLSLQLPNGKHLKERFCNLYPSQIAPAVATEMAEDAGQWCRDGADGGGERWFASGECVARLRNSLERGGSTLYEEKV